jgi:hypothetical protein
MTCRDLVHAGSALSCAVGAGRDAAACPAKPTPLAAVNQLNEASPKG